MLMRIEAIRVDWVAAILGLAAAGSWSLLGYNIIINCAMFS
jgi:hypothetical protein